MVKAKAFFGDFREISKEQAYKFCLTFITTSLALTREEAIKRLNENHLRGTTFEELEKEFA